MSNGRQFRPHQTETVEQHEAGDGDLLSEVVQATAAARYTMPELERIAKKAFASRMFGGGEDGGQPMSEEQAFMLMMISEATGDHPVMALLRWDIVKGKPAMKSAYVLAKFQAAGGNVEWVTTTDTEVHAVFSCKRHPKPFRVTLTLQELRDRKIAEVWDQKANGWKLKYNYKNHPRSMLRWRAVSEAVRAIDPGILMGMMTDVEAEDMPGPGQSVSEVITRGKLMDHLESRRERPLVDVVDAHGEVIEPPTDQTPVSPATPAPHGWPRNDARAEPAPEKPANLPHTAWGRWIAAELDEWNESREKTAKANPALKGLSKMIVPSQVVRHLLKLRLGPKPPSLYTAGKRDPEKEAGAMTSIWEDDEIWVQDEVREYLHGIIVDAMTSKAAEQPALPMGAT